MEQMKFEMGDLQQDAPKRVKRKAIPRGKLRALLLAVLLVLGLVAAFVLLDRTAFDGLRRSIAYMQADKDENGCVRLYQYNGDGTSCFADLNGSLLVASNKEITLLDDKGSTVYHTALQMGQAAVSAEDGFGVVYEIGGKDLYLLDGKGLVRQMTMEGEIFSVEMGQSGRFAVVLKKNGYKTAVSVYNGKGEPLYDFHSAQKYLMTAAVSENGKYMAAAAMSQDGGSFVSSLQIYKLTSDALRADAALTGGVYEIGTVNGAFCAVTDKALCFVKNDGTVSTYDYRGGSLSRCGLGGGKFAAVLLENYSSGSLTHLATVNTAGEEIASLSVENEVLDLSAAGRYLAVLYSNKLVIYDRNLQECSVLEDVSSARRVLMRSDGSAVLAGTNAASLYLP